VRHVTAVLVSVVLASCGRPTPSTTQAASPAPAVSGAPAKREVRLTGTVEAVRSSKVLTPQIWGQGGPVTLTKLIPNGVHVEKGDLIAVFDATQQADSLRNARARYDDLTHQVDQKQAQNRADAEKRLADMKQAEADLSTAELELQKGPILAEIDRLKNEVRLKIAREHVASLKKSNALHDSSDAAALRTLELQRDRQKVVVERTEANVSKLELRAPLAGMVAHQNLYRYNTMGHAQEGDQLYRGQALVSIFDPSEMLVRCAVGEPDGAVLVDGVKATVYLDAYPDLALPAHFEFASPVAASALGVPIKTFTAVFKLDKTDPHLMPDLSAAVVIEPAAAPTASRGGAK
jgi:HlyD family secretion protein